MTPELLKKELKKNVFGVAELDDLNLVKHYEGVENGYNQNSHRKRK